MGLYIWNWMMAMCNGFSVCSDFIIVVMTTVRYANYRINGKCEAYFGMTQPSNDSLSACEKKKGKTGKTEKSILKVEGICRFTIKSNCRLIKRVQSSRDFFREINCKSLAQPFYDAANSLITRKNLS